MVHETLDSVDERFVKDPQPSRSDQTKSLFVHSLPKTATTESLTKLFSQTCPLKHATIVLDPETKASRGYGFVTFADAEDAQCARALLNGSLFEGQKIKVEAAEPRRRGFNGDGETHRKRIHASSVAAGSDAVRLRRESDNQGPPKLIVRNLPWSIKEPAQLAALFTGHAEVKHAILPKKSSGLSPGFGFVMLRRRKEANHALRSVNGKIVEGRKLAVDWAVDKAVWDALHKEEDGDAQAQKSRENLPSNAVPMIEPEAIIEAYVAEQPAVGGTGDTHAGDNGHQGISEVKLHKGEQDPIKQTLFIQNVPFSATEDMLREHFRSFGSLRYARIVMDPVTERSKGVAFVCFHAPENAGACLQGAPRPNPITTDKSAAGAAGAPPVTRSLLESYLADPTGRYTLEGRVLQVSRAIQKDEAERLTTANRSFRDLQDKDKRRLYLLSEGNIPSNSPLYNELAASEIKSREDSARQRQNLIKGNPSLHLSLTRLSIRNLPHNITSKALKALARKAVVGFATEIKTGVRQPLSKEEIARGGPLLKEADKVRKAKGKGIVTQAKVVFEGKEGRKVTETSGAGRSRGYGFIEYASHRWALMGLRWLNGRGLEEIMEHDRDPDTSRAEFKDKKKRLIVEFAIENTQVTGRRQERETKARERAQIAVETRESGEMTDSHGKASNQNKHMARMRRKTQESSGARKKPIIEPALQHAHGEEDRSCTLGVDEKIARRQRIIGKKRMIRKYKK
jgi:nucleolar protein 4